MAGSTTVQTSLAAHGGLRLPSVDIDSYNIESRDDDGFIGDRVTKSSFRDILETWRKQMRKSGDDPLGETSSDDLSKKELDLLLMEGEPEAAGVLQGAIEDFVKELTVILRRFLKLKGWRDTDEAGLIGAAHLAPAWIFKGHDSILAVDIGGTNIRAGVVQLNLKRAKGLSKACVWQYELWRHAEEDALSRDDAVDKLVKMLRKLINRADKEGLKLAPFIGIGCPGRIEENGSIDRGAQNLPGNWASSKFNLPARLCEEIGAIDNHDVAVVMHNDAVVQGLSEVPFMQDVERSGVLTIGTGLGNARFTNRRGREA